PAVKIDKTAALNLAPDDSCDLTLVSLIAAERREMTELLSIISTQISLAPSRISIASECGLDMPINLDERYSRQVLFPPIGHQGQQRLAASRVTVIGCGATGSALASLLARAGVGALKIIDRDYVEPSNLQRQSLFDEADAAESLPKAVAA